MADAEVIVIGIDNSRWIPDGSDIFKHQCDAIEFYCRAKFEENPDTVVGLFTMSSFSSAHVLSPPTGSIEEIVAKLPIIYTGCGEVNLLRTFSIGRLAFFLDDQDQDKKKRMTLFVGGLTNLATVFAESYGKTFRDTGVAVDIIDLYLGEPPKPSMPDYQFGRRHLEEFINICNGNDNDNNHIVHVDHTDSICAALSKSILKKTPRLFQKEDVNVKRRVGGEESSVARGNKYGEHVTLSKGGKIPVLVEENVNVKRRVGGEESSAARGNKYGEHVTLSKGWKIPVLVEEDVNVKRRVGGEESSAARGNKYGEHVTLWKGGKNRVLEEKIVNVNRRVGGEESSAARGNKYGEHVTLSKGGKNRVLEEKNVNVKRRVGGEESSAARGIKYEYVTLSKKTGEA